MEFENRTFETEYRGSYVRQKLPTKTKFQNKQEYKDPIAESFKHYLSTDAGNEEENIENFNEFTKRYKEHNPKTGDRYFKETLDISVVEQKEIDAKKTSYGEHFCSFDGHEKYLPSKKEKHVQLPEGWIEGTTTQKWSYRNPVILFPNIYKSRPSLIKPLCESDDAYKHSLKNKKISELAGTIGELGTFILKNEMHGKIQKIDI